LRRRIGRSKLEVSALGLGSWAIGGPLWYIQEGKRVPLYWGEIDDQESITSIQYAIEHGVNFFDTADSYGAGHSETILGKAIQGYRDDLVIASKFGDLFEPETKTWLGHDHPDGVVSEEYVRQALDASLKRLDTDYLDLYHFHMKKYTFEKAERLRDILEGLVEEGKIRYYGWSTPYAELAKAFTCGGHCASMQFNYNILERNPAMLELCGNNGLAAIARGPYAMGVLTGKYDRGSSFSVNDMRHNWWDLSKGKEARQIEMLDAIRDLLISDGRSLPQAALGWLWAQGDFVVPIPGFKNRGQVESSVGALEFGPLSKGVVDQVENILREFDYDLIFLD